ncbi:MAG: hypothetical protein RLZZ127_2825, partial [Planctomycetota bacterium]
EPGIDDAAVWLGPVDAVARGWLRLAALSGVRRLVAAEPDGLAAGTAAVAVARNLSTTDDLAAVLDPLAELPPPRPVLRAVVLGDVPAVAGAGRRILVRLIRGALAPGDRVLASPGLRTATVRGTTPVCGDEAGPGALVWAVLDPDAGLAVGDVLSAPASGPLVGRRLRASWRWEGLPPAGGSAVLRLGMAAVPIPVPLPGDAPGADGIVEGVLTLPLPVAFDLSSQCPATARLHLSAGTAQAWGAVTGVAPDDGEDLRSEARLRDVHWIAGAVDETERAARLGHRPALVMVVGDDGPVRLACARALERRLFAAGLHAVMLDGTNLLLGLDQDLAADAGHGELVRRFGEVVHILLRTGAIVVGSTRAIGLADVPAVRALVGAAPVLAVDADAAGAGPCDLRLDGRGPEALAAVIAERLPGLGVV